LAFCALWTQSVIAPVASAQQMCLNFWLILPSLTSFSVRQPL